jgi:23S rRNA pseudouridine1911/1915/1917 synthase
VDTLSGVRIDRWLAAYLPTLSRTHIQRLIQQGLVTVQGRIVKANYPVHEGESIVVMLPEDVPTPSTVEGEDIPLDIRYEDAFLLVVNKPAGMVVHPAPGNLRGTLVHALLHHCQDLSGIGGVLRPGIVHRLDKDTSGLLVVAKDDFTHRQLMRQWKERTIKREYLALVSGRVKAEEGVIDRPIGRHPHERKKMSVISRSGRSAITAYRVKERFTHFTLLQVRLHTGRTHQIRVHMASIHHPVVGDPVYGGKGVLKGIRGEVKAVLAQFHRQALHAWLLGFSHPHTGKYQEFTIPLPADMARLLECLHAVEKEE